jgi:hypothetical protein
MIYKNIKKIMALSMLWIVISLGSFAGAQQGPPPQETPKKNPPEIPVGNKDRDKPNNNSGNKGNDPKNNDNGNKPKKP